MLEEGQLIQVQVSDALYYALPDVPNLISQKLSQSKVKILSPFDNLLIQRKRTKELFDYDYQIECYVPADKRKYGYFSLPLLWGQNFAGRMDVKMDRATGTLKLQNLHIETHEHENFLRALKPALSKFRVFNKGQSIDLIRITSNTGKHSEKTLRTLASRLL